MTGTVYTVPFNVSSSQTVKAVAVKTGLATSQTAQGIYNVRVITPVITPPSGTFAGAYSVTITCATPGATIRYTLDGTTPTSTTETIYTGPIALSEGKTVKAIATKTGLTYSATATATYGAKAAKPVITPSTGVYTTMPEVSITSATAGATIRYTTNGATPTAGTGTVYTAPFTPAAGTTVKAIAVKSGAGDSEVASATYGGKTAQPILTPGAGSYSGPVNVTITSATPGAAIRYTTNGTTPTSTTGTLYAGPVAVTSTRTLKAIAFKAGSEDSAVTTGVLTISGVGAPVIAPATGTYSTTQSVVITTPTSGASIRYTLDGSVPTASTGTLYGGAISISTSKVLKAIAVKTGLADSPLSTATYAFQVAAPVITPAGGDYADAQTVTMTTATAGASIRYTRDGSTPSATNGTLYGGSITVKKKSETIKAIAVKTGFTPSSVTAAEYRLADTDGDGLSNAEEPGYGTNPALGDTDDDGLNDGEEVLIHGTDPLAIDTDSDTYGDGHEVYAGTDPLDEADKPEYTEPASGIVLVYIPAGTFTMGDEWGDGRTNELPTHQVTLTQGYYLGKYEVTQGQWQAITGSNPSASKDPGKPVETVSWNEIASFIAQLNTASGKTFTLPTEAQWEYAAKGGPIGDNKYAGTSDAAAVGDYAWYTLNSGGVTHLHGQKQPSPLGLHDQNGNVAEWVADWYTTYTAGNQSDPAGSPTGTVKLIRGGHRSSAATDIRNTYRTTGNPATTKNSATGLRVLMQP
jgi:formylglycine-generating enzyme required for sulfatase activity